MFLCTNKDKRNEESPVIFGTVIVRTKELAVDAKELVIDFENRFDLFVELLIGEGVVDGIGCGGETEFLCGNLRKKP